MVHGPNPGDECSPVPDAPSVSDEQAAKYAPTQFAQDLAFALVDPVCRTLLIALVQDAVRQEIAAERARNLSASQGQPAPARGSTKTAWVGDRLRQQQAQQQGNR